MDQDRYAVYFLFGMADCCGITIIIKAVLTHDVTIYI